MSETTGTTLSGIEGLHGFPLHLLMTCHHHLSHSLTVVDDKRLTQDRFSVSLVPHNLLAATHKVP